MDFSLNEVKRFISKISRQGECLVWNGSRCEKGYGRINIRGINRRSHIISFLMFKNEPLPVGEGIMICHTCDNPPCINPAHLFIGTAQDNVDDMISKGRAVLDRAVGGFKHYKAIPAELVGFVRNSEESVKEVCETTGLSRMTVYRIRKGLRYTDAQGNPHVIHLKG